MILFAAYFYHPTDTNMNVLCYKMEQGEIDLRFNLLQLATFLTTDT
jgi:hypothetical protein